MSAPVAAGGPGRRHFLPARGLQRRIMLYVALGSALVLLFFSYVAQRALEDSTRIIYDERLHLAGLVSGEVEEWLYQDENGRLAMRSPERVAALLSLHASSLRTGTPDYHLAVVDGLGDVVTATHPRPASFNEEHKRLLKDYLARPQAGVVIHEPAGGQPHLVVYAPLPTLAGGIVLEQGRDAALAVPRDMLRKMGFLGVWFLALGLLLAWLTTRQVVSPLTSLTAITRRIAAGDLSTPVPQAGRDEVRDLAASFETMRRQLQGTHAELATANRELERRVQERTAELELRHADLASATRLLQEREAERTILLEKTIAAQEEERRRVARDLHDAVGQLLSTLVVRLMALESQASVADSSVAQELAELRALTSRTVGEVRRMIVDLRPELLDDMGLPAALEWYAEQVLGKQGVAISFDVATVGGRLSPQVELVVFRVLQEAINNIVKHAEAHQVRISLRRERDDLVGTVTDDGKGFESPRGGAAAGVGLIGMRERVALLGGGLQIRSAPGQGTRLHFRVPIAREESA